MIKPIGEALSNKIANLGFVCACLVVTIHINHPTSGLSGMVDRFFAGGISNVAVPLFFVVSGFLLAGKMSGKWWRVEVGKRIRTLIIPFLVWGVIAFLAGAIVPLGCDLRDGLPLGTTFMKSVRWNETVIGWSGVDLTSLPLVGALWYVRNLFFLVLVSPAILLCVRKLGWVWIGFTYALFCVWRLSQGLLPAALNGFFWYGFSLLGLTAFSLGILLRQRPVLVYSRAAAFGAALLGFGWWMLSLKQGGGVAELGKVFLIPCWGYALWALMSTRRFNAAVVSAAFPIFLMHGVFIGFLQCVPSVMPNPSSVMGYLVHVGVPIAFSIVLAMVLHRFLPRVAAFVFGGR